MELYSSNDSYKLYKGDMRNMLDVIKKESIDVVLTDPPYELNFMGKGWDNSGIAFQPDTWKKCYEVLKPGGYLLAFGGSRTFHRIACAIEDAGFEIRDTIMWLYGSGFPKSMDISKQIDKNNAKSRKVTNEFKNYLNNKRKEKGYSLADINRLMEVATTGGGFASSLMGEKDNLILPTKENYNKLKKILDLDDRYDEMVEIYEAEREVIGTKKSGGASAWINGMNNKENKEQKYTGFSEWEITAPATDLAKQWQGWGTALKPSFEPIIVARKPFKGSLVDNVIEYGVGGINIDECRVEIDKKDLQRIPNKRKYTKGRFAGTEGNGVENDTITPIKKPLNGRFPANTILTYNENDFDEVCGGFPDTKSQKPRNVGNEYTSTIYGKYAERQENCIYNDSGSASRYFMNCKYTGKDEGIWKQLLVNNVENNLEILKATKDNIAQMSVRTLLKELKDHYAKYVGNQLDLIETSIVQDIVKMLTWDFKIGTSQVIQDFIINSKKCIQFLNLVQFVEKMDNIDTTQTTQNLLKLFGYVKVVITNYIQGNIEYDQKRYIYTPKASKKDRDEGCQELEDTVNACSNQAIAELKRGNDTFSDETNSTFNKVYKGKNTHPTVKPTDLMQYLVRLVSPEGATILDCFNGSGSTGKAVMYENRERHKNYKYIGIELTEEYLPIAKARIEYVCKLNEEQLKDMQLSIFDMMEE